MQASLSIGYDSSLNFSQFQLLIQGIQKAALCITQADIVPTKKTLTADLIATVKMSGMGS